MRVFASPAKRRRVAVHALLTGVLFGALWVVVRRYAAPLRDPESVRLLVERFDVAGPLAFVALHTVQVVLVPIPGQAMGVAGGYLFGPAGLLYSMVGVTVGSYVAFRLARAYGRPYVESMATEEAVDRMDAAVEGAGIVGLTLLVALPGLPDDLVCFLCGMSDMTRGQFLFVVLVGRTPAFALATLSGARVAGHRYRQAAALLVTLVGLSALCYYYRERIFAAVGGERP